MDTGEIDRRTGQIVDAAMTVHSALGPGLLESVYQACLAHELTLRGLEVREQVPLPVYYKQVRVQLGFRVDLLVDEVIIVELKTVSKLHPLHETQLLSYLRMSGCRAGLLLNFHGPHMKDGIKRMVNGL